MAASVPQDFAYTRLAPGRIRLLEITTVQGKLPVSTNQQRLFDHQDVVVLYTHIADLNAPPLYDALSYTWGNPLSEFETRTDWERAEKRYSSKLPILCDNKLIYVGFSLYEALAGLRRTLRQQDDLAVVSQDLDRPRPGAKPLVRNRIWIDALCINQTDVTECNAQVKIMSTIYKAADAVLIWLGPQDEVARKGVRAMVNLSMAPDLIAQTMHLSEPDRTFVLREAGVRSIPDSWLRCMISLLQRLWFQRAWVIQEVSWARIALLICDERLWVDFNVLLDASDWMTQHRADGDWWLGPWRNRNCDFQTPGRPRSISVDRTTDTLRSIGAIYHETRTDRPNQIAKTTVRKRSLLELLAGFRESQCSILHDKVYSLLSLCWDQSLINYIPVDYSIPAEEVYIETARGILRSTGQLDLLQYSPGNIPSRQLQLPSWVPDWSKIPDQIPTAHDRGLEYDPDDYDRDIRFCADGNYGGFPAPVWEGLSVDPSSGQFLVVQGIRIASIKTVVPLCMDKLGDIVPVLEDISWRYSYFKPVPPQPFADPHTLENDRESTHSRAWARSDETRSEVLWRTVVANSWRGCHPAPDEAGLAFVRFLLHELGVALKVLEQQAQCASVDAFHSSKIEAESKRDGVVKLLRFLSGDEQRFLEEYYKHSSKDPKQGDMLVTQPRRYMPHIKATGNVSDLIHDIHDGEDEDLRRYREYMSGSRSAFGTDHCKLGLGPLSARCGDEVWVLNGAKWPFILRQTGGGTWEVVGQSYVHGIMHGQEVGYAGAVRLPLPNRNVSACAIVLE